LFALATTPDPRRSLTKGQRTRQRLLRVAVDRFGTQGFRGTSVSQLSRDAGLTPAAAYAYFADKDAYWTAAIEADLDALEAEIRDTALRSEQPIYDLMAGLLAALDRHALTRRVFADGTPDDLQLVLRHRLFSGTTALIADRLAARKAAGLLPGDGDPEVLARGIETVMFGLIVSTVRAGMVGDVDRFWSVVEVLRAAVGGGPTASEIEGV
jgi:AcrR family transcriptional regulator